VKPEIEEVVIYSLAIIIFGVIAFYETIIRGGTDTTGSISQAFSLIHDKFAFITNGDDMAAKVFTFGAWFIIGTLVYMLAWFLVSFSNGAFHDIEVSNSYVHPRSFNKSDFWASIAARVTLQVAAAISFLIYCSLWVSVLAPVWLKSAEDVFVSGITLETAKSLGLALLGIAVSLHIGAILLRVVLLRSKYFYER
jgi:hypothetical protein